MIKLIKNVLIDGRLEKVIMELDGKTVVRLGPKTIEYKNLELGLIENEMYEFLPLGDLRDESD